MYYIVDDPGVYNRKKIYTSEDLQRDQKNLIFAGSDSVRVVGCNNCDWIDIETISLFSCPNCKSEESLMNIDGTENFTTGQLKKLWLIFGDLPMNVETEELECNFLFFQKGMLKEEIWHWFDERISGGVARLLYEFDNILE